MHLFVVDAPRLTSSLDNLEVDLGSRVDLTCETDGNPTPSINWVRADKPEAIITGSTRFTIASITMADIGSYQCVVTATGFPKVVHTVHILLRGALLSTVIFSHVLSWPGIYRGR